MNRPSNPILFLQIESLERRQLLSGYTATPLASLSMDVGGNPLGGVVMDSAGNLYGTASQFGSVDGDGSIFEVAKGSSTATQLAFFNATNGLFPAGGLLIDSSGDLFGTTPGVLPYNFGDVFELRQGSGTIGTLAEFNGNNGSGPLGGLIMDSSGNLYGTTSTGGKNGDGTVFEIPQATGNITTLANANGSGPAGTEKFPSSELVMDSAGNLYGTDQQGGVNGVGSVFELVKGSTTLTNLASFNTANGADPIAGLTIDSAGNLYGTTYSGGGGSNSGTVFELAAGTGTITTLAVFNSVDGAGPRSTLLTDSAGDLFGTTTGAGLMNGTFFEVVKGSGAITELTAFSSDGSDGTAPQGTLSMDAAGDFYGATGIGGVNNIGAVFELSPIAPAVPTQVAFPAPPPTAMAGSVLSPAVTVNVEDSGGNVVTTDNSTVTLSIASGPAGATLGGTVSAIAVNGVATFSNLTLSPPGPYTLTASDGALASATSASFTITPSPIGAAAALAFMSAPAAGFAGVALSPAIMVSVKDANGNVVTTDNSTVTVAIATGPAGATLGGTVSAMAVNGVATFANLSLNEAGAYTLTATDMSLTAATSTSIAISAPSPIVPTLGAVSLPPAVVAGGKLKARIPVLITNSGSNFKGSVTVNIYADTGTSLDGNQVFITKLTRSFSIKGGKSKLLVFTIKSLPPMLPEGTYHLLAQVIDPSNLTNVTATTQTVQVAAAFIMPAVMVGAVVPASIAPGKSGSILVTVTNNGNVPASGVNIMLSPSTDGSTPLAGVILQTMHSVAKIQPGKSKTFRLHFKLPASAMAGSYFPYVSVTLGGVTTTMAGGAQFTVG